MSQVLDRSTNCNRFNVEKIDLMFAGTSDAQCMSAWAARGTARASTSTFNAQRNAPTSEDCFAASMKQRNRVIRARAHELEAFEGYRQPLRPGRWPLHR
jgi:hypothetical protein